MKFRPPGPSSLPGQLIDSLTILPYTVHNSKPLYYSMPMYYYALLHSKSAGIHKHSQKAAGFGYAFRKTSRSGCTKNVSRIHSREQCTSYYVHSFTKVFSLDSICFHVQVTFHVITESSSIVLMFKES